MKTIKRGLGLGLLGIFLIGTVVSISWAVDEYGPYHGNISTYKFHRNTCRYYDCKDCSATFETRDEAIVDGYIPCKVCKP